MCYSYSYSYINQSCSSVLLVKICRRRAFHCLLWLALDSRLHSPGDSYTRLVMHCAVLYCTVHLYVVRGSGTNTYSTHSLIRYLRPSDCVRVRCAANFEPTIASGQRSLTSAAASSLIITAQSSTRFLFSFFFSLCSFFNYIAVSWCTRTRTLSGTRVGRACGALFSSTMNLNTNVKRSELK